MPTFSARYSPRRLLMLLLFGVVLVATVPVDEAMTAIEAHLAASGR